MTAPTRFHSTTTGLNGTVFGKHSMTQVLQQSAGGGACATLGRYIAAALLNAAGKTPYLSAAMIRKM